MIVPTSLEKATATSPTPPALIPDQNSPSSTTLVKTFTPLPSDSSRRVPGIGRLLAQLVGTLLLVGLALHFIWWLVAGAVVVGGVWLSVRLRRQSIAATEREAARNADISARADQQHQWVMGGDPRGVYGPYPQRHDD